MFNPLQYATDFTREQAEQRIHYLEIEDLATGEPDLDDDEQEELTDLRALLAESTADTWRCRGQMEEAALDLVEEMTGCKMNAWPLCHLDEKGVIEDFLADRSEYDICGFTFVSD